MRFVSIRRLPLTTRAFLYSFIPVCSVLLVCFIAITAAVHQKIRQDLRDSLQNADRLLNIADAEFSRENSALIVKITDSAGIKSSVGLLSEAHLNPSVQTQVRSTIEAQLWELQNGSPYDFLAVSDLHGRTVAKISTSGTGSAELPPVVLQSGLVEIDGVLFQLQTVPIEIGGETAATLSLGRRFSLARSVITGDAVLLKNGKIILSTFSVAVTRRVAADLYRSCPHLESGCEMPIFGQSYVVSDLKRAQLGGGYQLLGFRSIDAGLQAFNRTFVPIMVEVGLGGVLLALLCTLLTSRSVAQPLRQLASQLRESAKAGAFPAALHSGHSVHEVDLVVNAFNHLAEAERLSRYELIEAKRDAESANRLKTEFLTNISHELRTPMNGVLGMTQLLFSTSLDQEQEEYATTVRDSAHQLLALIDDILDFSQIDTGEAPLVLSESELNVVFDETVAAVRGRVGNRPIAVKAICDPGIPRVLVDQSRLRQALKQLCDNAVKFTPSGSVVISFLCLDKTEHEAAVKFSVEDTGIGIAPENLELIFERFTQLDGSLTRHQGGTGIGLCVAKRSIELMGGVIGVESKRGLGSTFFFTLSLALAEPTVSESISSKMTVTQ